MLLQPITVPFSKSTLKPSVYTLSDLEAIKCIVRPTTLLTDKDKRAFSGYYVLFYCDLGISTVHDANRNKLHNQKFHDLATAYM